MKIVVWSNDSLLNRWMLVETVKRGRREKEQEVAGRRSYQSLENLRCNVVNAALVDEY